MNRVGKISTKWLVVLALAVSLGFQLATIGRWSIWPDEGYTGMLISYPVKEVVRRTGQDVHPPLYYLILKAWQGIVGWNAVGLRLLSVIFMLLAIYMTFLLVRKLCGERSARWSLLPLALAPALIRYGQEMRMYAFVAFLGAAATLMLVTLLTDKKKLGRDQKIWLQVGYGAAAIAMIYSHYFSSLLLVVHVLMIVGKAIDDKQLKSYKELPKKIISPAWRGWVATYVIVVLAFLPWLPKFLTQSGKVTSGFWIGKPAIDSFFSTLSSYVLFRPGWLSWHLIGWYAVAIMVTAAVCFILFRTVWKTYRTWFARLALLGYFLIPTVILFVISLPPFTPVYYDRYLVIFAPMFFASLGVGLGVLYKTWKPRQFMGIALTLVVLLSIGLFNASYYGNNYGLNPDEYFRMKPLVASMQKYYQPGDAIVAANIGQYQNLQFYTRPFAGEPLMYAKYSLWPYGNYSIIYDRPDLLVDSLEKVPTTTSTVWLVTDWRGADQFIKDNVPSTWVKLPFEFTQGESRIYAFHKG